MNTNEHILSSYPVGNLVTDAVLSTVEGEHRALREIVNNCFLNHGFRGLRGNNRKSKTCPERSRMDRQS